MKYTAKSYLYIDTFRVVLLANYYKADPYGDECYDYYIKIQKKAWGIYFNSYVFGVNTKDIPKKYKRHTDYLMKKIYNIIEEEAKQFTKKENCNAVILDLGE